MRLVRSVGLAALLTTAAAGGAYAQSDVEVRQKKHEIELIDTAKETNKECESEIAIAFDWTNVPADRISSFSPVSYCDNMLYSVRRICGDKDGKAAVKQEIKSISCGFGPERTMSLKDGKLDYKIQFDSSNDADFAYEYLMNHL